MKILPPKIHGFIDYVTVCLFLILPGILGLTGIARTIAYALAGIHFALTIITDFQLGAFKLLPLHLHGWVERAVGPVLIVLPFVLGFDATARTFYVAIGIVIVLVGLFSDYRSPGRTGA